MSVLDEEAKMRYPVGRKDFANRLHKEVPARRQEWVVTAAKPCEQLHAGHVCYWAGMRFISNESSDNTMESCAVLLLVVVVGLF